MRRAGAQWRYGIHRMNRLLLVRPYSATVRLWHHRAPLPRRGIEAAALEDRRRRYLSARCGFAVLAGELEYLTLDRPAWTDRFNG